MNRESGSVRGGEAMNHRRPWRRRMRRRWRKPPSRWGAQRRRPLHSARCRSTWREWTAWRASRRGAPPWRRACAASAAICWTLRCWYLREKESHGSEKKEEKQRYKHRASNGSGKNKEKRSIKWEWMTVGVFSWFYFNFLGLCFVFVFMFNSLYMFNLMFLFSGFVIFRF